jgi:hypothetical protein
MADVGSLQEEDINTEWMERWTALHKPRNVARVAFIWVVRVLFTCQPAYICPGVPYSIS